MLFQTYYFLFDNIPCTEYGLMLYDIENSSESEGILSTKTKIIEDRIPNRIAPLHYACIEDEPLEFELIFGLDQERLDRGYQLDRADMEAVARWLTGHKEYKWLEIEQQDMSLVRYRCIISDLRYIPYGSINFAFKCTVRCDSGYGYMHPQRFVYDARNQLLSDITIYNQSTLRDYYYPKITIESLNTTNTKILNITDDFRNFGFSNLPSTVNKIHIDNSNGVITANENINVYPYIDYNFNLFRLKQGINKLVINKGCIVTIECEFPIKIGG